MKSRFFLCLQGLRQRLSDCSTIVRVGDVLVVLLACALVLMLFQRYWLLGPATKVKVLQAGKTLGIYSLQQEKTLTIHGVLGDSVVHIHQGRVRFTQSPCPNKYCIHQGWLQRTGQVAICLPNQISIELIGHHKSVDSLTY